MFFWRPALGDLTGRDVSCVARLILCFYFLFFDLNYCCMHLSQADGFDVIRLKILFFFVFFVSTLSQRNPKRFTFFPVA